MTSPAVRTGQPAASPPATPAPAPAPVAAKVTRIEPGVPRPKVVQMPAGRHAVMLFHGLTSTPMELLFLARGLHQAGFTVRLPVIENYSYGLPGAGQSDHRQWMHAALAEFDALRPQYESVSVGGLCIGSLLALKIAAARSREVAAVIGLSTTLYYDGWASPWARYLLPLVPLVPFSGRIVIEEREPYGVKDERLRAWIAAQMRESGGSSAGAAKLRVHDLYEAQRLGTMVRRTLPSIQAPTLVIHAEEDEAASPRSAHEVAARVSAQTVKTVLLKDSYHMISIDREKHQVLSEMKEFLLGQARNPTAVVGEAPAGDRPSDVTRSAQYVHA